MSIYNLILLFALICFVLTVQARPHHVNKKSYHGDSVAEKHAQSPSKLRSVSKRSVMWSGASSYPGYRDSRKRRHNGGHRRGPSKTYLNYAAESGRRPIEPISVQLHNKERANDARYREGLQELASLM